MEMKSAKKDWNYDMSVAFKQLKMIVIAIGIAIIIMKFFVNEDFGNLISGIYANGIMLTIFISFLYQSFSYFFDVRNLL